MLSGVQCFLPPLLTVQHGGCVLTIGRLRITAVARSFSCVLSPASLSVAVCQPNRTRDKKDACPTAGDGVTRLLDKCASMIIDAVKMLRVVLYRWCYKIEHGNV